MAAVVFDADRFKLRYPEFAAVSDSYLGLCFDSATLYLSNADKSPVQDLVRREQLLFMLTAHVAATGGALSGGGAQAVGRVSSAAEGSVSAIFDFPIQNSAAYFAQTQYGVGFWQATSNLRGFRYRARSTRY
jgi:hypothetical protein